MLRVTLPHLKEKGRTESNRGMYVRYYFYFCQDMEFLHSSQSWKV